MPLPLSEKKCRAPRKKTVAALPKASALLIAASLAVAACGPGPLLETDLGVAFPRRDTPEGRGPSQDSLTGGELIVDDRGCLRLSDDRGGDGFVLVWPSDYELVVREDEILVLDGSGAEVGRVGEDVEIGGGPEPLDVLPERLRQELPERCPEPQYWVVSEAGRDLAEDSRHEVKEQQAKNQYRMQGRP